MTKERIYYIAYEICKYIRERETQNQFKDYEFCMYVSVLAQEIEHAIDTEDYSGLEQYYEVLNEELDNLVNVVDLEDYAEEVKELISLLDECKN